MGTSILLLSEATIMGVVALAAIVVVALVILALVALQPRAPAPLPAAPVPIALPQPLPVRPSAIRPPANGARTMEIDVPTKHVDEFMAALRASGWRVHETGDVVATDDDEEGLTTVLVDVPTVTPRAASGEEIR